jgi:hypothetical protein
MKIGDPIWRFDENRRVYPPIKPGRLYSDGPPIWREHWEKLEIRGETSRSWLVGAAERSLNFCKKLAKDAFVDGACPRGWALSETMIDELAWVREHGYRLGIAVQHLHDYATLRKIAQLIGYETERKS